MNILSRSQSLNRLFIRASLSHTDTLHDASPFRAATAEDNCCERMTSFHVHSSAHLFLLLFSLLLDDLMGQLLYLPALPRSLALWADRPRALLFSEVLTLEVLRGFTAKASHSDCDGDAGEASVGGFSDVWHA